MSLLGGRFALVRELGSGDMSTVFLGRDEVLDRPVAIKILKPGFGETDIGARFRREGLTAARLSHPNIVQVYDAGEGEFEGREVSYIVMEYVAGGDLKDLIDRRGTLPGVMLSRIGAEVAAGLTYAHERGVIHRDIKPQNVLVDNYGRTKLTDFGIARALDATYVTQTGSYRGTTLYYLGAALYSSPEQLLREGVTPKSDVYSLGATLYHVAVGEPPFSGNPLQVATQQVSEAPTPPRVRGAAVSEGLEALILSCLAKGPAERPDTLTLHERLLQISAAASAESVGVSEVSHTTGPAKAAGAAFAEALRRGLSPLKAVTGSLGRAAKAAGAAFAEALRRGLGWLKAVTGGLGRAAKAAGAAFAEALRRGLGWLKAVTGGLGRAAKVAGAAFVAAFVEPIRRGLGWLKAVKGSLSRPRRPELPGPPEVTVSRPRRTFRGDSRQRIKLAAFVEAVKGSLSRPRRPELPGPPEITVSLPGRTFGAGSRQRMTLAAFLLALLLLALTAVGLRILLASNSGQQASRPLERVVAPQRNIPEAPAATAAGNASAGEAAGGAVSPAESASARGAAGGAVAPAGGTSASEVAGGAVSPAENASAGKAAGGAVAPAGGTSASEAASEPVSSATRAEQAVFDMYYQMSFARNKASWAYLSERLQQQVGYPGQWAAQEDIYTFTYMRFTSYPTATVSGNVARVRFEVRLDHTWGSELLSGTWVCVVEDGEWKLDRLSNETTQPLFELEPSGGQVRGSAGSYLGI